MRVAISFIFSVCSLFTNAQGTLMTVAGTGVSGFGGDGGDARLAQINLGLPTAASIAFASSGDVLFTDKGNYRIRKIDLKTGVITTFAGNGGRGYSGDGGLALVADINRVASISFDWRQNLLLIDSAYCRIRSINPSGVISYIGGTTCGYSGDGGAISAAKFEYGSHLTAGDSGTLYLGNVVYVRYIDRSGVISKYAGGTAGFSGDGGLAIYAQIRANSHMALDINGSLSFVDGSSTRRVRHIDRKGIINSIAGNGGGTTSGDGGRAVLASLGAPVSIAYDQFGNYFIGQADMRIRRVDSKDSVITTIAGTGVNAYSGEGVDAKTSSIAGSFIFFDTAHYEIYFGEPGRIRKITNLVKPVSINEAAKTYTPEIYPNPATTQISVSGVPIRSEVWIYDLLGREQYHTTMQQMEETVDVSKLVPGTYILRAKTPKGADVYTRWVKG